MSDTTPTPASISAQVAAATERIRGTVDDPGFPPKTPVDQMTPIQQASYWKFHSRQHELRGRRWDDVEQVRARLAELQPQPVEPQIENPTPPEVTTEDEAKRAAQAERTELRRSALLGELIAATGHSAEFFDVYLPHVFVDKFFNDDGTVDRDAVKDAAKHFIPKASTAPQAWNSRGDDPIAAAMARIGNTDDMDSQISRAAERIQRGSR